LTLQNLTVKNYSFGMLVLQDNSELNKHLISGAKFGHRHMRLTQFVENHIYGSNAT